MNKNASLVTRVVFGYLQPFALVATLASTGCMANAEDFDALDDEMAEDVVDDEGVIDEEAAVAEDEQALIVCNSLIDNCGGTPPYAPSSLSVYRLTSAVHLAWLDNSSDEFGFRIQRRRAGTTSWTTPSNPSYPNGPDGSPLWYREPNPVSKFTLKWVDRTATPGITYEYRVGAYNLYGTRYSSPITVAVPSRPMVTGLTASQRTTLASEMQCFLTDAMVNRHPYFRHMSSGSGFLYDHRRYIQEFEDHLMNKGRTNLVPMPMWSSATTIPTELRPVRALDNGTPRTPITNPSPNISRPSYLVPSQSCSYSNLDSLGMAAQSPWHGNVHGAVGGSMGAIPTASAAFIFLPWHAYVDDVWTRWQKSCQTN